MELKAVVPEMLRGWREQAAQSKIPAPNTKPTKPMGSFADVTCLNILKIFSNV